MGQRRMNISIPLYSSRVMSDIRHESFLYFVGRPSGNLQNDLAQRCRAEDVDVIRCVTSTAGDSRDRLMGQLEGKTVNIPGEGFESERYLDCRDLYPAWVPPLPLPPFNTHRAEAQQAHCPIPFTHFHSIKNLRCTGMSRLPNAIGSYDPRYLWIRCMIRVLVVDTTGFVQRQVQRTPSGFAFWTLLVRHGILVFISTTRVPTGRGQETTHRNTPICPTNTNAKGE